MTEHERNQAPEPHEIAEGQGKHPPSRGMSRRRFGQAALGSVPVLLAFHSNPLRAGSIEGGNCHPSGWVSGGSQHGDAKDCGGRSPGYWGSNNGAMSEEDQERLFVAAFEYSGNVYYEDEDLSQELRLKYAVWSNANGGPYAVYQSTGSLVSRTDRTVIYYGTAALLNSEAGFYNGSPTAEEIKDLVRTALNGENYETSTGEVPLGPEEVALFLENITADPFFLHEA